MPFGQNAQIVQRRLQHRQQAVNPIVGSRLAQLKKFAHQGLQRIGLEVDQKEQEFLLGRGQVSFTASPSQPSTGLMSQSLVSRIHTVVGPCEGSQQQLKLRKRQAGEGQKLPTIIL